jgi:hypothetical protein
MSETHLRADKAEKTDEDWSIRTSGKKENQMEKFGEIVAVLSGTRNDSSTFGIWVVSIGVLGFS